MQHIQDKAFDQMFKDKLEAVEIQPTADLWHNIVAELKPARKLPVYWMAAALAALVTAAGLLMPKTEPIRLQGKVKLEAPLPVSRNVESVSASDETTAAYQSTPLILPPPFKPESEKVEEVKPVKTQLVNEHLVNKSVVEEVINPVKYEISLPHETVLASHDVLNDPSNDMELDKEDETGSKGIRNMGDLINFMVNKVDKREKKLIQFDTDDDNSSIIALNIGFIKLNRKSDK